MCFCEAMLQLNMSIATKLQLIFEPSASATVTPKRSTIRTEAFITRGLSTICSKNSNDNGL